MKATARMTQPQGSLTPTQLEIMDVVWSSGSEGVIASEIWQQIVSRRSVVRTTILNQVDRLEKRGWLRREQSEGGAKFFAMLEREATENRLAKEFLDDFFQGSVSTLVSRLFGGSEITEEDAKKMQEMIDSLPRRGDETGHELGKESNE